MKRVKPKKAATPEDALAQMMRSLFDPPTPSEHPFTLQRKNIEAELKANGLTLDPHYRVIEKAVLKDTDKAWAKVDPEYRALRRFQDTTAVIASIGSQLPSTKCFTLALPKRQPIGFCTGLASLGCMVNTSKSTGKLTGTYVIIGTDGHLQGVSSEEHQDKLERLHEGIKEWDKTPTVTDVVTEEIRLVTHPFVREIVQVQWEAELNIGSAAELEPLTNQELADLIIERAKIISMMWQERILAEIDAAGEGFNPTPYLHA